MKIKMTFKNGQIHIDVEGAKGKECIEATDKIMKALGAKLVERKLKPEYYRQKTTSREYEYAP